MIDISKCSSFNKRWLKAGTQIELEHTNNIKTAEHIAKQHLCEFPGYYKALRIMERHLKRKQV